jgi:uncharacterized protein YpmB
MKLLDMKAWIVTGSVDGINIDGYEVHVLIGDKKYQITNKELEQFKIEK